MRCAVFPLYYTGHQIQKGRTNSYVSVSDFMKYTTANLPRGSWRYWCAACPQQLTWGMTACLCLHCGPEREKFLQKRPNLQVLKRADIRSFRLILQMYSCCAVMSKDHHVVCKL